MFNKAKTDIQKDLEHRFFRLAKNNGISLVAARQLLNGNELKEFKWDVKEYLQKARENKLSNMWVKELEKVSAKVHISRLDAMKLSIRNTLETAFGKEHDIVKQAIKDAYADSFYHAAMEIQNVVGVNWNIGAIDDAAIEKIISKPWTKDARTFSDIIWAKKELMIGELHDELTRSCVYGSQLDDSITRIEQFADLKFKNAKYAARRLVVTERDPLLRSGTMMYLKSLVSRSLKSISFWILTPAISAAL